jgi:hypothetical protein
VQSEGGVLTIGDWSVVAEMDAGKPAALLVRRNDGQSALALGHESLELGGKTYRTDTPGATWLVESSDGEFTVKQACDEPPAAAR